MEKPIELAVRETKQAFIELINNSRLPAFIMKPILKDLFVEISNIEESEYLKKKAEYDKSLEENENG